MVHRSGLSMCLNRTLSMRSVRGISGATVEHNKFCVSVHFRNVDASRYDAVLSAVEATLQQHQELHATRGRKVFEIRPQVGLLPSHCSEGAKHLTAFALHQTLIDYTAACCGHS